MRKIKNKKTYWCRKIDPLWSKIIRAYGKCERCGSTNMLNAHHIQGRTSLALRFDLQNGLCLCAGCHFIAHNKFATYKLWLDEYLDPVLVERLDELDKPTYGEFDYEGTYNYLKDIASRL